MTFSNRKESTLFIELEGDEEFARDWSDPTSPKLVTISAGHYEVERVPSHFGEERPWLLLKGTKIGMFENMWRRRAAAHTFKVTIIETPEERAAGPEWPRLGMFF